MFKLRECDLFSFLSVIRSEIASECGISPGMVLTDDTMSEIARRRPQNAAELGTIAGIGTSKLEHYGARLLAVIPPTCQWCRARECLQDDYPVCSVECLRALRKSDWALTGFNAAPTE